MSTVQSWEGPTPAGHAYEFLEYRADLSPEQLIRRRRDWIQVALDERDSWMRDSREMKRLPQDIMYLMGDQWLGRRPSYKASPVNNRLLRSMEQTVAILTDIRPIYEVKSHDDTFDDQATLMTNIIKAWWLKNDVDFQLAMAVIYAYLSTGFLRIVWNKNLCNGRGDFAIYPCSPYDVTPIGPAHNFQDWEGCIYEAIRPVSWFRRNFPGPGSMIQPNLELSRYAKPMQKPGNMGSMKFEMLSPQMQNWVGTPREFGDSAIAQTWYREFWIKDYSLNTSQNVIRMGEPGTNWYYEVKPGQALYPRGRLIMTGGSEHHVLYDGPNFFWHGKFPFVMLRLKPVPWQTHGLSELMSKIPLQDIVNTILAGVMDMIKKAVNPPLLFPDNAFSDAIKNALDPNMPNAKIGYNPMAAGKPEWQNPPNLPSYVSNMVQYAQNEMDDDSGLLDLGSIARKKVSPAGDTLEQLKESQQTIMRLRGRYIELGVRDLGEQMTPNICQFYTLNRRMWMFGRAGVTYQDVFDANLSTFVPAGHSPIEHSMLFSFEVGAGSLLNVNQGDQRMLAMALRRQKDMDRKTLYQQLDMEQIYSQVEKGLEQEQNDANAAQVKALLLAKSLQGPPQVGPDGQPIQQEPPPPIAPPPPGGQMQTHKGVGAHSPEKLITPQG